MLNMPLPQKQLNVCAFFRMLSIYSLTHNGLSTSKQCDFTRENISIRINVVPLFFLSLYLSLPSHFSHVKWMICSLDMEGSSHTQY